MNDGLAPPFPLLSDKTEMVPWIDAGPSPSGEGLGWGLSMNATLTDTPYPRPLS